MQETLLLPRKPVSHFLLNLSSTLDGREDQRLGCVRGGPDLDTCAELALSQCHPQDCRDPWCKAQRSSAFSFRHPRPAMGTCRSHGSSFWVLTAFSIRRYPLSCYTFLKMRLILFLLRYVKTGLVFYVFIYFCPFFPKFDFSRLLEWFFFLLYPVVFQCLSVFLEVHQKWQQGSSTQ